MTTIDLKRNFHQLIDNIEDEELLAEFYNIIKTRSSSGEGQLWNRLTYQQQKELLSTLSDIDNPEFLICNDKMKKKHGQLL